MIEQGVSLRGGRQRGEKERRTAFSMSAGHSWSCCLVEANMGRPVEVTGSRSSKSVAQRDVSKAPC